MKQRPTYTEYVKIHNVCRAIIKNVSTTKTENRQCLLFAILGCGLLRHIGIKNVHVSVGASLHCFELGSAVGFANLNSNGLQSDENAFHAWCESDKFYIDFSCPTWYLDEEKFVTPPPKIMLVRSFDNFVSSDDKLVSKIGNFYCQNNPELGKTLLSNFLVSNFVKDLISNAIMMYDDYKIGNRYTIYDTQGGFSTISITSYEVLCR